MRIKKNFVIRSIANSNYVIPRCEEADRIKGIIFLNSSSAFLWRLLENDQDEDTLCRELMNHYDIEQEKAINIVREFIYQLNEKGYLEL